MTCAEKSAQAHADGVGELAVLDVVDLPLRFGDEAAQFVDRHEEILPPGRRDAAVADADADLPGHTTGGAVAFVIGEMLGIAGAVRVEAGACDDGAWIGDGGEQVQKARRIEGIAQQAGVELRG